MSTVVPVAVGYVALVATCGFTGLVIAVAHVAIMLMATAGMRL